MKIVTLIYFIVSNEAGGKGFVHNKLLQIASLKSYQINSEGPLTVTQWSMDWFSRTKRIKFNFC